MFEVFLACVPPTQRLSICSQTVILVVDWNAHATNTHDMAREKSVAPLQECDLLFSRVLVSSCFFYLAILVAFVTFVFIFPSPFFLYLYLFLFWNV